MVSSTDSTNAAQDRAHMQEALRLAEKGRGRTSPNPMVGAVVVQNGRVVGRGFHAAAGLAHAEVNAIDASGSAAAGATLYVTLAPCHHYGRTPPCTQKILAAGIRRVVAAMEDPNPSVPGGGLPYLAQQGIAVTCGICREAAEKLNEAWIKFVRTGRPFVILKCAATLDGRIATRTGDARWISNESSRTFVHRLRDTVDGILVGIGTVRSDDPSLTTRLPEGGGRDPVRIILDSHLSIDENARVLRLNSDSDTILATGRIDLHSAAGAKKKRLEQRGVRVLETPLQAGRIQLDSLFARLGEMRLTSLLIEGGAAVIGAVLAAGAADKLFLFFAPKLTGGDDGVPICRGPGPARMADCIPVAGMQVHRFESDVLIEGYLHPQNT